MVASSHAVATPSERRRRRRRRQPNDPLSLSLSTPLYTGRELSILLPPLHPPPFDQPTERRAPRFNEI